MRRASPLAAALAAALLSVSANAATPLFSETFSGNTGDWSSSSGAASFDNQGWECTSACKSQSAIKLGTGSAVGTAKTPSIPLPSGWTKAAVTVSFQTAAWYGTKSGTATLSVLENNLATTNVSWTVPPIAATKNDALQIADLSAFATNASGTKYEVAFEVQGPFQLLFETAGSEKRLYLDTVVATAEQIVSSGPVPLATPNGLAAASVTDAGFSLSWNPVANADAYAVDVRDGNDAAAGSVTVTGTGATVTGLSPDTVYTAKVQAVPAAGSTVYTNSVWSDGLSVRTGLSGGLVWAPVFLESFGCMTNTASWGSNSKILSSEGTLDVSLTDMDAWYGNTLYDAPGAPRFGNASNKGWVQSPGISLSNGVSSATVRVTFPAIALHANAANSLVFSVLGADGAVMPIEGVSPVTLSLPVVASPTKGSTVAEELAGVGGAEQMFTFTAPAGFKLKFDASSSNHGNVAIDDVLVRQVVDPAFAVLAAPTGVQASDVGTHGFTVSWTAVADASGYEVLLGGAVAGSFASTDTSMQLTGLADGTTFSVQVRALGDGLHHGSSNPSTAVSVTTDEDAQSVVFTVTGAPAGDVFAGDAVSFTVAAQVEATGAAAPVNCSGIAGATFANGVFSWTPAEANVGTNIATFASGYYTTNVAISVVSTYKTEPLATEYFEAVGTTWSWVSTSYTNRIDGDMGPWTGFDLVKTKSAIIVGKAGSSGSAVSPAVDLKVRTPGSFSVSFDTASLSNKTASVQAQLLDAASGAVFYTTNFPSVARLPYGASAVSDAGARFTVTPDAFVSLPAAVKLAVTTYKPDAGTDSYRAYLDTVVFTQTVSAKIRDLPAPTGLALSGTAGETGFEFGWTAVSGATGYAVRVLDSAGEAAGSVEVDSSTATAAATNLADDVSYTVQVRALGDAALWFDSPWSDALAVRTARSSTHPTLTFGGWQNAVGDGKIYAGIANAAAVSAVRDDGTNAVVTLESVSPAPVVGPTFGNDVLAWTPADADTNKTFTVSFLMDGTYATNLSFKILSVPPLHAPAVTVGDVTWKSFGLSWDEQDRAAGYGVRAWTDCPNPGATATRVEEAFAQWPAVRPSGWTFRVGSKAYGDASAPVKLEDDGHFMETYDLGGPVSSVSFHATGHSIANSSSTLTVVGIGEDGTETVLASLGAADIGQTDAGIDRTISVPAGTDVRKVAWRYAKDKGGVGVGTVVIAGEGFSTPRWLPGWGPAAKDVGLVQSCTVAKPRPGKATGVNPANKKEDLFDPRVNYAEVTARDVAGVSLATVVPVEVPAPPRSARATIMVFR